MSKYIDEIIEDLKTNPNDWRKSSQGVQKNNIVITEYGNTAVASVITVYIDNVRIPSTYLDRYKLEKVVTSWYKSISLNTLLIDVI